MQPYDYVRREQHFDIRFKESGQHWLCHDISFSSAHPNRYQRNNIAHGEYYMPGVGNFFPLAILLHGLGELGERNDIPCKMLARDLAKTGIASVVLKLMPPAQEPTDTRKRQSTVFFIDNWLELYQVLVINIRQVIDWTENRNELDSQKTAVLGISAGGMASAIAMAADKRITAGVFLVIGGNMEKITWSSKSDITHMSHECTETQCHETYSHYPQYLADIRDRGIENVAPAKECFLFDPLSFASYLHGRPVLMINAEQDEFVPRDSTLEFWEMCGHPRIVWLPASHNTILLRYRSIRKETTAFITSTFGMEHET